jgi:hypothetical protein
MRNSKPNMSAEESNNKIIAHNYGHGISGWTLSYGASVYVNDLLIELADDRLNVNDKIVIIGAGIMGMLNAYDLIQRGFQNITIIAEKFDNLASHNAGGMLLPTYIDKNYYKMQKLIEKISIDTYKFYSSIANNQNKELTEGVSILPAYFESREESGLEMYVGKLMDKPNKVLLDFKNGTRREMFEYRDALFIDTSTIMSVLYNYLKAHNVNFIQKKIFSFTEIDNKIIIDCSGIGAAVLNKDQEMKSLQGHLIALKDQNPQDLQYTIFVNLNKAKTKYGQNVKRLFYMLPKHTAYTDEFSVIGGSLIEGSNSQTPNNKEFNIIIKNAKKFYGIIN